MNDIYRKPDETVEQFCQRLYRNKDVLGLTWVDLADILNEELGYNYSPDKYRKDSYKYANAAMENLYAEVPQDDLDLADDILDMRIERTKLADERTQVNALYRRIAREDSIKEMAHDIAAQMNAKFILEPSKQVKKLGKHEGILLVSDWHYGIEIDSIWNVYNPDIAKKRIAKLRDETLEICKKENITKLHVVNLGDLIAGRIHLQLRINSRFDVITQVMEVSELLAEMLSDFSKQVNVEYYDTLDNHSRLEPNLKESLELESLARITTWYLKERVGGNIQIHDNEIADDIISFESFGHKIVGVHGNKDKSTKIIDNLSMMTKQHYDLVVSAHLHHFSCEEKNETVLVSNSSMMGTDDYAEKLRLSAKPSQCLIITSPENACENIYKINLD